MCVCVFFSFRFSDVAFKSGPSSLIELERYEEHEDVGKW